MWKMKRKKSTKDPEHLRVNKEFGEAQNSTATTTINILLSPPSLKSAIYFLPLLLRLKLYLATTLSIN